MLRGPTFLAPASAGANVQEDQLAERTLEKPAKKWAREYETIYILRPNVATEEAAKVAGRVRDVMSKMGGKLTKVDIWGKRRLAYNIGNYTRGIFVYVAYAAHGDLIAELERNLRLLEPVIRYQTIVIDEQVDLDTVEVDAGEIEFADIEQSDDDEEEPSTAERLGMAERKEAPVEAAPASEESSTDESEDSESDEGESEDDDSSKNEEEE